MTSHASTYSLGCPPGIYPLPRRRPRVARAIGLAAAMLLAWVLGAYASSTLGERLLPRGSRSALPATLVADLAAADARAGRAPREWPPRELPPEWRWTPRGVSVEHMFRPRR